MLTYMYISIMNWLKFDMVFVNNKFKKKPTRRNQDKFDDCSLVKCFLLSLRFEQVH